MRYETLMQESNQTIQDEYLFYEGALTMYQEVATKLHDAMRELTSQSSKRSKSSRKSERSHTSRSSRRSNESSASQIELAKQMADVALKELQMRS